MAVSDSQFQQLINQVRELQRFCNNVSLALNRMITDSDLTALNVLYQTDMASIKQQIEALESRITDIEEEPLQ